MQNKFTLKNKNGFASEEIEMNKKLQIFET